MDELSAIRAKRLAELSGGSAQTGNALPGVNGALPGMNGAASDPQKQQEARAKAEAAEEETRAILGQILEPDARERLSRIALVRPERSRAISELLIRMARSGQLRGKVSEPQLLSVLDQIEANERSAAGKMGKEAGKITFSRRKPATGDGFESDEDDDLPARARPSAALDDDDDDLDI